MAHVCHQRRRESLTPWLCEHLNVLSPVERDDPHCDMRDDKLQDALENERIEMGAEPELVELESEKSEDYATFKPANRHVHTYYVRT